MVMSLLGIMHQFFPTAYERGRRALGLRARRGVLPAGGRLVALEVRRSAGLGLMEVGLFEVIEFGMTEGGARGEGGAASYGTRASAKAVAVAAAHPADDGADCAKARLALDDAASTPEEQCPICFEPFLAGDRLRVLPCHRSHRFHPECIDPYLVAFSSRCPLCQHDLRQATRAPFTAVETEPGGRRVLPDPFGRS